MSKAEDGIRQKGASPETTNSNEDPASALTKRNDDAFALATEGISQLMSEVQIWHSQTEQPDCRQSITRSIEFAQNEDGDSQPASTFAGSVLEPGDLVGETMGASSLQAKSYSVRLYPSAQLLGVAA